MTSKKTSIAVPIILHTLLLEPKSSLPDYKSLLLFQISEETPLLVAPIALRTVFLNACPIVVTSSSTTHLHHLHPLLHLSPDPPGLMVQLVLVDHRGRMDQREYPDHPVLRGLLDSRELQVVRLALQVSWSCGDLERNYHSKLIKVFGSLWKTSKHKNVNNMTYKSMNKNEIKIQLLKISADNTFGVHYISKLTVSTLFVSESV